MGMGEYCTFDPSIVRGLAYYTGVVFEVHDIAGELRAICGGGRYDNLLRDFGGPPIPATGMGMGDCVLEILLEQRGLLEKQVPKRELEYFVALADPEMAKAVYEVTARIRLTGAFGQLQLPARRPLEATQGSGRPERENVRDHRPGVPGQAAGGPQEHGHRRRSSWKWSSFCRVCDSGERRCWPGSAWTVRVLSGREAGCDLCGTVLPIATSVPLRTGCWTITFRTFGATSTGGSGPSYKSVKNFDFLLFPRPDRKVIVEVKGRTFAGTTLAGLTGLECWVTVDDIESLQVWRRPSGHDHEAIFVFAYRVAKADVDFDGCEVALSRLDRYVFFCVRLDDYLEHMNRRSPKWRTVTLPADSFRRYAVGLSAFLP